MRRIHRLMRVYEEGINLTSMSSSKPKKTSHTRRAEKARKKARVLDIDGRNFAKRKCKWKKKRSATDERNQFSMSWVGAALWKPSWKRFICDFRCHSIIVSNRDFSSFDGESFKWATEGMRISVDRFVIIFCCDDEKLRNNFYLRCRSLTTSSES